MIISGVVGPNAYPAPTGGQHITLVYMGDSDNDPNIPASVIDHLVELCETVAASVHPFVVPITRFGPLGDAQVLFLADGSALGQIRTTLVSDSVITELMQQTEQFDGYTPHMSVSYPDDGDPAYPDLPTSDPIKVIGISLGVAGKEAQFLFPAALDDAPVTAAAGQWDEHLHPRGKDGKFIRKFGIVKFLDGLSGKWSYGKVVGMVEGSNKVPDITVRPSDLGGTPNGKPDVDLPPSKIYAAPVEKAHLGINDPGVKKIGGQGGSNPGGLYELPPVVDNKPKSLYTTMAFADFNALQNPNDVSIGDKVNIEADAHGSTISITTGIVTSIDGNQIEVKLPNGAYDSAEYWHVQKAVEDAASADAAVQSGTGPAQYYIKKAQTPSHGQNEALANDLYTEAGVFVPEVDFNPQDGYIYSKIIPGTQDMQSHLDSKDQAWMLKVQENFAVDAWLSNRDVFGMTYDNILTDAHGTPVRIDNGGALLYRAQGEKKTDFGSQVTELDVFRGGKKAAIFGPQMPKSAELDGAQRVLAIPPERIKELVSQHQLPKSLADTLIARRAYIANYYGLPLPESIQPSGSDHITSAPLLDAADLVQGGGMSRAWSKQVDSLGQLVGMPQIGDELITAKGSYILPLPGHTIGKSLGLLGLDGGPFQLKKKDKGYSRPKHNSVDKLTPTAGDKLSHTKWERGDQLVINGEAMDVVSINDQTGGIILSAANGTPISMNVYNLPGDSVTIKRWDAPSVADTLPQPSQKTGLAVDIEKKVKEDLIQPLPDKAPAAPAKTDSKPGDGIGEPTKADVKSMVLGDGTTAKTGDVVVSKKDGKEWVFVKPKGYSAVVYDANDPEKKQYMKTASTLTQPGKAPDASVADAVDTPKSTNGVVPQVGLIVTAKDGKTGAITWVSPDGKSLLFKQDDGKVIKKTTTAVAISEPAPKTEKLYYNAPEATAPTAGAPSPGATGLPGHDYGTAGDGIPDLMGYDNHQVQAQMYYTQDLIPGETLVYASQADGGVLIEKWANQPQESLYTESGPQGTKVFVYGVLDTQSIQFTTSELPTLWSGGQAYHITYEGQSLYGRKLNADGSFTGRNAYGEWFHVPADATVMANAATTPNWPDLYNPPTEGLTELGTQVVNAVSTGTEGDYKKLVDWNLVPGAQVSMNGTDWYTVQKVTYDHPDYGMAALINSTGELESWGVHSGANTTWAYKPAPATVLPESGPTLEPGHHLIEDAPGASMVYLSDGNQYLKVGNQLYDGRSPVATVDSLKGADVYVGADFTSNLPSPIQFHELVTLASNNYSGYLTINGHEYSTYGVVTGPDFSPHVLLRDTTNGNWIDGTKDMFAGDVYLRSAVLPSAGYEHTTMFPDSAKTLVSSVLEGKAWVSPDLVQAQLNVPKLQNDFGKDYLSPVDIHYSGGIFYRRGPNNEIQRWNPDNKAWETDTAKVNLPTDAIKVIDGTNQAAQVNYLTSNMAGKVEPQFKNLPVYNLTFADGSLHTAYKINDGYYQMKPDGSMSSLKVSDALLKPGAEPKLEHDPWAGPELVNTAPDVTSQPWWPEHGKVVQFTLADGTVGYAVKPDTSHDAWQVHGLDGLIPASTNDKVIDYALSHPSAMYTAEVIHDGTPDVPQATPETGKGYSIPGHTFPPDTLAYTISNGTVVWAKGDDNAWHGYNTKDGANQGTVSNDIFQSVLIKKDGTVSEAFTLVSGDPNQGKEGGFDWKSNDFATPKVTAGKVLYSDGTPLSQLAIDNMADTSAVNAIPAGSTVYIDPSAYNAEGMSLWVETPDGQHLRLTQHAGPLTIHDGIWNDMVASKMKTVNLDTFGAVEAPQAVVTTPHEPSPTTAPNDLTIPHQDAVYKTLDGGLVPPGTVSSLATNTADHPIPAGGTVYVTNDPYSSTYIVHNPDGTAQMFFGWTTPVDLSPEEFQQHTAPGGDWEHVLDLSTVTGTQAVHAPISNNVFTRDFSLPETPTGTPAYIDGTYLEPEQYQIMVSKTAAFPIPAGYTVYARPGNLAGHVYAKGPDGTWLRWGLGSQSKGPHKLDPDIAQEYLDGGILKEINLASLVGDGAPAPKVVNASFKDLSAYHPVTSMVDIKPGDYVHMENSHTIIHVVDVVGKKLSYDKVWGSANFNQTDMQAVKDNTGYWPTTTPPTYDGVSVLKAAEVGEPVITPTPVTQAPDLGEAFKDSTNFTPLYNLADIKPGDWVYSESGNYTLHVTAVDDSVDPGHPEVTYDKIWFNGDEAIDEKPHWGSTYQNQPETWNPYLSQQLSVLHEGTAPAAPPAPSAPATPAPSAVDKPAYFLNTDAYKSFGGDMSQVQAGDFLDLNNGMILHVASTDGGQVMIDKTWDTADPEAHWEVESTPYPMKVFSPQTLKVLHNGTDVQEGAPKASTPYGHVDTTQAPNVKAPDVIPGVTPADAAAKAAWGGDLTKTGHVPFPGMSVFGIKGLQGKIISISPDKTKATVLSADGSKTTRKISALKSNIAGNYAEHAGPVEAVAIPEGMHVPYTPPGEVFDKAFADHHYIGGLVNAHPGVKNAATVVKSATAPNGTTYARVHFTMTTEQREAFVAMMQAAQQEQPKGDWVPGTDKKLSELAPGDVVSLRHSSGQSEWVPDKNGVSTPTHKLVSIDGNGIYTFEALDGSGTLTTPFTKKTTSSGVEFTIHSFNWDANKAKPMPKSSGFKGLSDFAKAQGWQYSSNKYVVPSANAATGKLNANPGEFTSSSHLDTNGGFILKMADGTVVDIVDPLPGQNSEKGIVTISIPQGGDSLGAYGAAMKAIGMSHMEMTQENVKAQVRAALVNMLYLDASKPDSSKGWSDEKIFSEVAKAVGIPDVGWQDVRIGVQPEQGRTEFFWSQRVIDALAQKSSWNVVARGGKSYQKVIDVVKYGALDATTRRFLGFAGAGNGHSTDSHNNAGNGSFMSGGHASKFVTGNPINTGYGGGYAVYHRPEALFARIGDIRPANGSHDAYGAGGGTGSNAFNQMTKQPNSWDLWMAGGLPGDTIGFIAMNSEGQRMEVINQLHKDGVFTIGGRPLEDVIQTASALNANYTMATLPPYLPNNLVDLTSLPA